MNRRFQVSVIGDSREIEINNRLAESVGEMIAKNHWLLISGGRGGVMQAASMGAARFNGEILSILPDSMLDAGNPYATIVVPSGIGFARNSMNVLSADAVVMIGGGAGTLSEAAYAWTYRKTIFALTEAKGWSARLAGQRIDDTREEVIKAIDSLDLLERALRGLSESRQQRPLRDDKRDS